MKRLLVLVVHSFALISGHIETSNTCKEASCFRFFFYPESEAPSVKTLAERIAKPLQPYNDS